MTTCDQKHDNIPKKDFENLPYSQAAEGRHRCARCAYELGQQKAKEQFRERVAALVVEIDLLKRKVEDLAK